jgi:hypothetical protein
MKCKVFFSAVVFSMCSAFGSAYAAIVLSSVSQGSFGFIRDGTSNTVQFGENTRAYACFDNVTIGGGVTDGTSNTILLSESVGLRIVPNIVTGRQPIQQIADGTTNTIIFPEISSRCLGNFPVGEVIVPTITDGTSNTIQFGENTRFDVCFSNVRLGTAISDGTSNTIQFGENLSRLCYEQVRVSADLVAALVPEPGTLSLLGIALVFIARRRDKQRPHNR